jgi:very-short-patch-repair endonuclease
MTKRARCLRRNPTDAEKKLWHALRRDQINNLNFKRQHPVGPYTLDFYCSSLRLGIEVDGGQHAEEINQQKDQQRTSYLASNGIVVVQYWNNDVLRNLEGVLTELVRIAEVRPKGTPSPTLPLSGGGRGDSVP